MKKIRIVLASNYEMWWEGLAMLLAREEDLELVDTCYDSTSTLNRIQTSRPDVVLIDEELPGCECSSLLQQIAQSQTDTKSIVIIRPDKNHNLSYYLKCGAKGFVIKDITFKELANSIRQVIRGGLVIASPGVVREFIEQISSFESGQSPTQIDLENSLSKREREILALLAMKSITNREIAQKLYITESTVKAHLSSILEKMKVRTRHQAASIAREKIRFYS